METTLFYALNHLPPWGWLEALAVRVGGITQEQVMVALFAALFVGLVTRRHALWQALLVLIVAVVGVHLAVDALKALVQRPRPTDVLPDVRLLSANRPFGHAFPSAHAAHASLLLGYAWLFRRRELAAWLGVLVLLGVLRVYQGFHYPSDIVGGWLVGLSMAWLAHAGYLRLRRVTGHKVSPGPEP